MLLLVLLFEGCAPPRPLQFRTPTAGVPEQTLLPDTLQATTPANAVADGTPVIGATATLTPTVVTTPTVAAVEIAGTPIVIVPPTQSPVSSEAAWQAQQSARQDFGGERPYVASTPVSLLWFDPATGQTLEIGRLIGEFVATAQFELSQQQNAAALAVPYRVDQDYGLTAISPAVKERMRAAGYSERVEAYVLVGEAIVPAAAVLGPTRLTEELSYLLASSTQSRRKQRL